MSSISKSTASSSVSIPESQPSICIPRVFDNIEKKTIWEIFTHLFGREAIDRIDVVYKEAPNGEKFKRVFVHFRAWPKTYECQAMRKRLLDNQEVKIVYDEPWFWKCTASRVEKPQTRDRPRVAPYVDFRAEAGIFHETDTRGSFENGGRKPVLANYVPLVPHQILRRPAAAKSAPASEKKPRVSDAAKQAAKEAADE